MFDWCKLELGIAQLKRRQTKNWRETEHGKHARILLKKAQNQREESRQMPKNANNNRLSYKEKKELESLPKLIEVLESSVAEMHEAMANPDFFKQAGDVLAQEQAKLKELEENLASSYERWEELEQKEG